MTKLFTAGLLTETSDLSPMPTTAEDWQVVRRSEGTSRSFYSDILARLQQMAYEKGWQVTESICATAFPPGGRIVSSAYQQLKATILTDLKEAMPVDGVLRLLHGAAMAQDCDDCEGDLLAHIRQQVGSDIPIAVELDPHCHITASMMDHATMMVLYKTFLHTDIEQQAIALFRLLVETIEKKIKPVMSVANCGLIQDFDETHGPMKQFMEKVDQYEQKNEVLSISPVRGFPFADTPDVGSKIIVVTDNNKPLANSIAQGLAAHYAAYITAQPNIYIDMETALVNAKRKAAEGQLANILVEVSDAAGYGFSTDSTELLEVMLNQGMSDLAIGLMLDSIAVSICHQVGVGVSIPLRIGGKIGRFSGSPMDLQVSVERLYKSHRLQTTHWGIIDIGDAAVVSFGSAELILISRRVIGYDLQALRDLGVDPDNKTYVLLKCLCDCDNADFVVGGSFDPVNWPFSSH